MTEWLKDALGYAGQWLEYQMKVAELPGCGLAVAKDGELVLERAFGVADLKTEAPLAPEHRFRVASHSKTFTAVGIMKLHEAGRLHLDDKIGQYVEGLDAAVATVTIAQLLSHGAGILRDGTSAPHWQLRNPFFNEAQLRAQLAEPLAIDANTRFKYSNLGFGLLGLAIEAITGETYNDWINREVVEPSGLRHTLPDTPLPEGTPVAAGHSGRMPFGRGAVAGDGATYALAAATGFVSTAGDLARFFASLDPAASTSILSVASRREMTRRHWQVPHQKEVRYYGLGTMAGSIDGHAMFGHGGAFPGFISRTVTVPEWGITVSIVTNAIDGPANPWVEGIIAIMHQFSIRGAPTSKIAAWSGRWWTIWGAVDLVPMGEKVLLADPSAAKPFVDATELEISSPTEGRIALANGFGSHGERAALRLGADGKAERLFLGGTELMRDAKDRTISFE